jgi:hypothetical protein
VDPSLFAREGAIATVTPLYENLRAGPAGQLILVDPVCSDGVSRYRSAELDNPQVLREGGFRPDMSNTGFHCQMVYAVGSMMHEAFSSALGRRLSWAFGPESDGSGHITVRPFALEEANAYYSRSRREISLGYFKKNAGASQASTAQYVFSSLSADVIAHEFSHALLDSVKPYYREITNPDLAAFHESFADLMALFQRLQFKNLIRAALENSDGSLGKSPILTALAPDFAKSSGLGIGLRTFAPENLAASSSFELTDAPLQYHALRDSDPHELGSVLTEAILEALVAVVELQTAPLRRLHARGRQSDGGYASPDFVHLLTEEIVKISRAFQAMCIRALDYAPPVDLQLGEFLRALITVDSQINPEDSQSYREAIITAFRRRGLFPRYVSVLSESALRWGNPLMEHEPIDDLSFANLRIRGDPSWPTDKVEALRQGGALARRINSSESFARELGLATGSAHTHEFDPPEVIDIRPTRRVGHDGEGHYELVAQVIQCRRGKMTDGREFSFYGGASIFFDWFGRLRCAVRNRVDNDSSFERVRAYIDRREFVEVRSNSCFR